MAINTTKDHHTKDNATEYIQYRCQFKMNKLIYDKYVMMERKSGLPITELIKLAMSRMATDFDNGVSIF